MDLATVKAALAHDPRFDALVEYLAEKFDEPLAAPTAPAPAEVAASSAVKREGLIERIEDKLVGAAHSVEAEIIHLVGSGAEEPTPPAAA